MPKRKNTSAFQVPAWDTELPDVSKQFKVKEIPFVDDVKKTKEAIEARKKKQETRKKLKAKRVLSAKPTNGAADKTPEVSFNIGRFVRAPSLDDSDDDLNPINLGRGMKRQRSDDDDSDSDVPQAVQRRQTSNVIKPSAFGTSNGDDVAMEDSESWQVIQRKKKKVKSMDIDDAPQSNFRNKLVDSLKGSRFRFLNEQMYKCEGKEALKMFKEDPQAFTAYHEGYRQQVQQWPTNPLDRIIKGIKKLPINNVVVDFGCGEARLAKEVPHEVISVDLVAAVPDVIACDMANTPLKGETADVVVFCLSLMGVNLKDFLLEANRVLKARGTLKVAEVASRFDNVKHFIQNVEKCGFQLANQDLNNKLFYFFNFRKVRDVEKTDKGLKMFSLKPCLYKKR